MEIASIKPIREPEFRLAKTDDLKALLELYSHLHRSEPALEMSDKAIATWKQILEDTRIFCFVIADSQQLLASCILDIVPNLTRGVRPFGVLQNVVTLSSERGRGLGTKLITKTLEFAWARDCYQVLVQSGQPKAIPFYKKIGFRDDSKVGLVAKPMW